MLLLGQPVAIRASIGVAVATHDMTTRQLLHEADLAMYAAKRRGGHDVELHADGNSPAAMPAASLGDLAPAQHH